MPESEEDLARGRRVGEYVVDEKLGAGGFGAVYRATHPVIGKEVAIKVLGRQFSASPQMVSRFVAEARAVNQIRHRSIIDIFSFGQLDDGRHYYVMELLRGEPLDRIIAARGRLPVVEALAILRPLARALDAVHAKGIAHRDLKPENVFVCKDEDGAPFPKLLDFGIAKLIAGAPGAHKTQTGAPLGTPYYMSPEQCRGRPVDSATDVYSFGIVTYEALTGKLPFDAPEVMEVLIKQISERPAPPSHVCPEVPEALDAPILWMLEKEAARRPDTLAAAVRALEAAAGIASAPGLVETPMPATEAKTAPLRRPPTPDEAAPTLAQARAQSFVAAEALPARRRRPLLIGIGGLVAIAAGAGLWLTRGAPVAAPPDVPPRPAAVAAPPPPDAPRPATVLLEINAKPAGAEVLLDGELLGTAPGVFSIRAGDTARTLLVRKPDYEPQELPVVPRKDVTVAVTLEKRRRVPPPPAPKKPHDKETIEVPDWNR